MGGAKVWITITFATFVWLLTAIVALSASVSWTALLLRSFSAAAVVGALTYGIIYYLARILTGDDDDNARAVPRDGGAKGERVDVQVPAMNPFVPGQIDADLDRLLADDPSRAAEIVRKMQLDD
ncbi:hypothetical protein GTO89_10425 [Heliobacterium gestii]|uniref:Uncharacterized protein n=1 Tax=Heliomicrobium gestii TaxID=2699 RepID=A0A845LDJ9_HELGE|nr:hypothetical protein [Heliomicrobium gestii]MBM7867132.1 hypothetical protein [Heliomicrobium gestii]MZP43454.1 hypothetical protein [Heliomicrobium gestii]